MDLLELDPETRADLVRQMERLSREEGAPRPAAEMLLPLLTSDQPWTIRLHLTRMTPRIDWTAAQRPGVIQYLLEQAKGTNRFISAWALDALATLAENDDRLAEQVIPLLLEALDTGSAAVKVRARNGLRRLGGLR